MAKKMKSMSKSARMNFATYALVILAYLLLQGLSFSGAVNVFVRQAVREGGLPFAITKNVPGPRQSSEL